MNSSDEHLVPPSLLAMMLERLNGERLSGVEPQLADYVSAFPDAEEAVQAFFDAYVEGAKDFAPVAQHELRDHFIGPYRILEEIGRGGQGVVYLAEDPTLSRKVALKVLLAGELASPEAWMRFQREVKVTARLQMPGICPVHGTGVDAGRAWIAMAHIEGQTLSHHLAQLSWGDAGSADETLKLDLSKQQIPETEVVSGERSVPEGETLNGMLKIVEQCALTLHAAHEMGIVHRDVKPGNIMLDSRGRPIILDFGLAHDSRSPQVGLTNAGDVFGTPAYMSPEQVLGEAADNRTDVWALGVVLYECLTLERPFVQAARETLTNAICHQEPPDIRRRNPAVSRDLAAVVEAALQKPRGARYASAHDLAKDLRAVQEFRPVSVKRLSAFQRIRRWAQREPAWAALLMVLSIGLPALGVVGGMLASRWGESESHRAAVRAHAEERALEDAFLSLSKGSQRQAVKLFSSLLQAGSRSPEAVAGLALAHLHRDNPQPFEALLVLEDHKEAQSLEPALLRIKARALRLAGRTNEAKALLQVAIDPTTSVGHYILGADEMAKGESGDHLAFKRSLAHHRRAILHAEGPRALLFYEWAHASGHCKDRKSVEEVVPVLRQRWPKSPQAWFWAGVAWHRLEATRALLAFKRARELDPQVAAAWGMAATILFNEGKKTEALRLCNEGLAKHSDYPNLRELRGILRFQKGDLDGALSDLRRATAHRKGARSWPALAHVLNRMFRFKEGVVAAERALSNNPKDALAWRLLGDARGAIGEFRSAQEAYSRAARFAKDEDRFPPALLAQWAEESGEAHRLASSVNQMLAEGKEPTRGRDAEEIAFVLRCKGQHAEAVKYYRKAFALSPELMADLEEMSLADAALSAVRAAAGDSPGSQTLSKEQRQELREQARLWISAVLQQLIDLHEAEEIESGRFQAALVAARSHPDLESVRDAEAMKRLTESEQAAWSGFWKEVEMARVGADQ